MDAYVHHMFSWRPGEHPTMEAKLAAVREGLKAVGLDDRIAIAVAHNDTDPDHVHTMTCRVHPYTGLAAKLSHSKKKLQKWAEDYERRHGGIQVPARVERRKERAAFEAAVAEEMKDFEPTARILREQQHQQAEARRAAKRRVRATGRHRLTPVQPQRGPGGAARTPTDWNPREKTAFNKLYRRQREDGTDRPTAAAERRKLWTRLERKRRRPTSGLMDAIREGIREETITPDPPPVDLVPEPSADTRDTATPPRSSDFPLKRRLQPGVAGPQRSGLKPESTAPPTKRRTPER